MIGLGKAINGLYLLQHRLPSSYVLVASSQTPASLPSVHFNFVNNKFVNADLWHFRLGHPSYAKLSLLHNLISGLQAN